MNHTLIADDVSDLQLANFDPAPADRLHQDELVDALRAVRGMLASPVPVMGWRGVAARLLHLPIRPSSRELAMREAMLILLRTYDQHLHHTTPSSKQEGATP